MGFSNLADFISLHFVAIKNNETFVDAIDLGFNIAYIICFTPTWGLGGALDALSSQANGRKDY